jgi:membrane dipeptidase
VVDLSHVGIRTSLDALEVSRDPVVFGHSNVRKLTDHVRNLTDEQIRAIGPNGGVIGLSTHSVFTRLAPGRRPTLDDLLRHMEYVIDKIGIDHVGLGTDMVSTEGIQETIFGIEVSRVITGFHSGLGLEGRFVEGFASFAEVGNLTDRLLRRGYRDEDVLKILGGNFMRVFKRVWDGAADSAS